MHWLDHATAHRAGAALSDGIPSHTIARDALWSESDTSAVKLGSVCAGVLVESFDLVDTLLASGGG